METFLQRLVANLLSCGVRVTVACAEKPDSTWMGREGFDWIFTPPWGRGRIAAGVSLARLLVSTPPLGWVDLCRMLEGGKPASLLALAEQLMTFLPFSGRRWDVIYFPWNGSALAYAPLFRLGVPVLVSCRGSHVNIAPHDPSRTGAREGLAESFAKATAVHCVSDDIARTAARWGLDPSKATIIRPAVDPEYFTPSVRSSPGDRFTVVATGSLAWVKGHEYALSAIRNLVERGISVRFDLIGDGPERQRVLYTVRDLDLEEHVRLLGRLSPDEVRARLQNADAFLLSSLSEGISNAVLEAMACGIPVVTTACGGMREAVADGSEGFVVPVRDPRAIADALERLARDPDLRSRMGAAGRQRILNDFTLDQQTARFAALLSDLAWQPPSGTLRRRYTVDPK